MRRSLQLSGKFCETTKKKIVERSKYSTRFLMKTTESSRCSSILCCMQMNGGACWDGDRGSRAMDTEMHLIKCILVSGFQIIMVHLQIQRTCYCYSFTIHEQKYAFHGNGEAIPKMHCICNGIRVAKFLGPGPMKMFQFTISG